MAESARAIGVHVIDLGSFDLRNVAAPVDLYELEICMALVMAIDPVHTMSGPSGP